MAPASRFIQKPPTDPKGLEANPSLPYNLRPQDVLRMVEDLHELLHDINVMLVDRHFDRMEELLDPAGFSGFVSRTIVDRVSNLSRALVKNEYHNGYPDLLLRGVYPSDSAQHGTKGGLEVKASRGNSSWQAHGPRAGWFLVVQFDLDQDEAKALRDREPTRVLAVLVAQLEEGDWSWQPAAPGRIRSGTASIKPSGTVKLRSGAAWVEPAFKEEHDELLVVARRNAWRPQAADDCLAILRAADDPMKASDVVSAVAPYIEIPPAKIRSTVNTALRNLVQAGRAVKPSRGLFEASQSERALNYESVGERRAK